MKIIALAGVYDSGKTTVLLNLLHQLKQKCNAIPVANSTTVSSVNGRDRREVVQIRNGRTVLKVGVCTGGDTRGIIQQNFSFFNGNGCDVCVTACRSVASTETVDEVLRSAQGLSVYPYFVAKMRTNARSQGVADSQTVAQLISMII